MGHQYETDGNEKQFLSHTSQKKIYNTKTCRLSCMLILTVAFFLVEVLVGYLTNSMALIADSFHMLSDVIALLVGLLAVRISRRKTSKNTFGWARAEVLGALVNSVFLFALCFSVFIQSLKRLFEPEKIMNPKLVLVVGAIGLLVNLIGLGLLHGHGHGHSHGGDSYGHSHKDISPGRSAIPIYSVCPDGTEIETQMDDDALTYMTASSSISPEDGVAVNTKVVHSVTIVGLGNDKTDQFGNMKSQKGELEYGGIPHNNIAVNHSHDNSHNHSHSSQMNMRGVFLHVLGDALGSVIVVISAVLIWKLDQPWVIYVDPSLSMIMILIILSTTVPLLKESAHILLQTVPTHIKVDAVQDQLMKDVNGVLGVHEFHVWRLAGNRIIASAHIQCRSMKEYMRIARDIKALLHNLGIHSTTIQPEFMDVGDSCDSTMDPISSDCILNCGRGSKEADCSADKCCPPVKKPCNHSDNDAGIVRSRRIQSSPNMEDPHFVSSV